MSEPSRQGEEIDFSRVIAVMSERVGQLTLEVAQYRALAEQALDDRNQARTAFAELSQQVARSESGGESQPDT